MYCQGFFGSDIFNLRLLLPCLFADYFHSEGRTFRTPIVEYITIEIILIPLIKCKIKLKDTMIQSLILYKILVILNSNFTLKRVTLVKHFMQG